MTAAHKTPQLHLQAGRDTSELRRGVQKMLRAPAGFKTEGRFKLLQSASSTALSHSALSGVRARYVRPRVCTAVGQRLSAGATASKR